MDGERRRVVVTGLGLITPLGARVEKAWAGPRAGKGGIGLIRRFDASDLETKIAGEVHDFDPLEYMERKEAKRADRFAQFAVATAGQALKDAKLEITKDLAPRIGVTFGSGIGGLETRVDNILVHQKGPRRASPCMIPMMIADLAGGGKILGWISGYGATADAYHITAPPEGAEGIVRAMHMALDDAGIGPEKIGYVNAHGTSTQANDGAETAALKTVFGSKAPPVSSTKSMTGHTIGAAGAIEAGFCLLP